MASVTLTVCEVGLECFSACVSALGTVISQLIVADPRAKGRINWRSVFAYTSFGSVLSTLPSVWVISVHSSWFMSQFCPLFTVSTERARLPKTCFVQEIEKKMCVCVCVCVSVCVCVRACVMK